MASSLFGPNKQLNTENQNGLDQRVQYAKSLMETTKGVRNPQDMLLLMAKKNPNIRPILQLVAKHNGDPKAAFYALAEEKGVNPDDIINALNK